MKTVLLISIVSFSFAFGQNKKWSPPPVTDVEKAIIENPAQAAKLIRSSFGSGTLVKGKHWVENTRILWMVESEQPVSIYTKDGSLLTALKKLDDKGLQAAVMNPGNQVIVDFVAKAESGKEFNKATIKIENYSYPPESFYKEGVPKGAITRHSFNDSKIYPDTNRELEVYIPAQYKKGSAASLLVFQDGLRHAEVASSGGLRAPVVMDNLIAAGDMPVTIGIFVNPGSLKTQKGGKPRNRSVEYDSLGDTYVNFLLDEIIPFVKEKHGVSFVDDPAHRAIAGGSSGCACAWTAAWERPDKFGKVLGWVGTFVDIRGANAYPSLVRKTERKPIRAALLGEKQDIDNQFGNWPLANRQMETALRFQNYDYRYWWGNGFHGSRHAAVMLPAMMRWLWSDVTAE
ncbi:MAG: alpha/beta hydrolase-fold protein [Verrucomicrobiales bacterium]|nr:alpha/beta hydrolase-fold protein [Verrucomicrobiales bacterium]